MNVTQTTQNYGLVLCRSDAGDGGWSLHAPESTDESIASGEAPWLISGPAVWKDDRWSRPTQSDYDMAQAQLQMRLSDN